MFMDLTPEYIQKMTLTPKVLLSMYILQLNIMDLRMFMQAELEENPLLEEEASGAIVDEEEAELDKELSYLTDGKVNDQELPVVEKGEIYSASEDKKHYWESLIAEKESLYGHLHWQLEVLAKDSEQESIGEFLIGNLDDKGYLKIDLQSVQDTLKVSSRSVKSALSFVRSLDPIGVGARNLKESLLIQLISAGKGNTNLYRIVYSHLEDLEKGNFEKIAKELSIPVEEAELAKKRLSYLNPNPGSNFSQDTATRILPDVFLDKNNGDYNIEVNSEDLPKIKVSHSYINILRNNKTDKLTKDYIRNKLLSARWLIDAVKRREKTLMRICEYLIEIQKDFLELGDIAAKPLTLNQVAGSLSVSEATVSRTVSNKYLQTPTQLYSLKRFFVRSVRQESGRTTTVLNIKNKIRELIEENPRGPLSDGKIASLLRKEGITISRRTVSKYRESLGILPFNLRKNKSN